MVVAAAAAVVVALDVVVVDDDVVEGLASVVVRTGAGALGSPSPRSTRLRKPSAENS